jgi:hypothetical protein
MSVMEIIRTNRIWVIESRLLSEGPEWKFYMACPDNEASANERSQNLNATETEGLEYRAVPYVREEK